MIVVAPMLAACSSSTPGSDSISGTFTGTESGVTVTASASGTTAGSGSATGGSGNSSSASAGETSGGFKFDVGDGATGGSSGGPTLGSCRASEIYGAAGGYPAFNDPAYASFTSTVLIMTSHDMLSTSDPVLRVFDISGPPPPPNMNYAAPRYIHPSWTADSFGGGIFGLTLDSDGNIYIAPSMIYNGDQSTPGTIYKVDRVTAAVTPFATLPNNGPAFGNINYDCVSETLRVTSHEDCRIYQIDMSGQIRSTYRHSDGDVTMGPPSDPGEPDGSFCPLGDRMWAVQSHYGKIYYSVWWEDSGRQNASQSNEIWSVECDDPLGIPDGSTKTLEATIPGLNGASYSNPVSDLSFAATGWMLAAERTMYGDTQTSAHQSTTYELQQMNGMWQVVGTTYVVGELPNSSAGGVDHDFAPNGYVWMTGDALDFYTPDVVYGVQGTPYGGGDITNSTIIDHDGNLTQQYKTALGDCEVPIPGNAKPPPPPTG